MNPEKYDNIAKEQDVTITKNGKNAAAKPDKKAVWDNIVSIFREAELHLTDEEIKKAREERGKI